MTLYILRRFAQAVLSMLITTFVLYMFFVYISSSGVYRQYQDSRSELALRQLHPESTDSFPDATPADLQNNINYMEQVYKVDQPWPINFLLWLFDPRATTKMIGGDNVGTLVHKGIDVNIFGWHIEGSGILTGDVDTSSVRPGGLSLGQLLSDRGLNTLLLMTSALFFALLLAIPVGIIGAIRQHSWLDTGLTFMTLGGLSIPPFMLAFILSALFGILPYNLRRQNGWDWFPMLQPGYVFSLDQEGNWINRIYHLSLPVATLSLALAAWFARHVRSSMLEVLHQDYIRTAMAKGAPIFRIVTRHAFRNALVPLITVVGLSLPAVISGSMIIEQVFSYPGMGQLFFKAVGGCVGSVNTSLEVHCTPFSYVPNPAITLGLLLVMVVIVALSSMLADILYVAADPRINLGKRNTQ